MVQVLAGAVLVEVDAGGVELEGLVAGVDGDGDGPHRGDGQAQRVLVAGRHVHEAHVLRARVLGVVPGQSGTDLIKHSFHCISLISTITKIGWLPALIVHTLIGIALLGVDAAVVLDVFEGVVHEAAVAAVVAVRRRAVDQVLLRQGYQETLLTEVLALEGSRLYICSKSFNAYIYN